MAPFLLVRVVRLGLFVRETLGFHTLQECKGDFLFFLSDGAEEKSIFSSSSISIALPLTEDFLDVILKFHPGKVGIDHPNDLPLLIRGKVAM